MEFRPLALREDTPPRIGPFLPGPTIVIRLFGLIFVICSAALCGPLPASAETFYTSASSFAGPHPAVVRVVAPERDGTSYGSGALVAVNESSGLVLTNWHVVRDAAGPLVVYFPDGFRSGAYLLRTDRDWDLAALAIRRPNVQPIPIAADAPKPGEELTIAGYGSGSYRAVTGRLTQYVSPGGNQPFEMIELSAPARNGDSGGPILNRRGELAGTLFGSAFGRTTGSYCGRLRWFMQLADGDFRRVSAQAMLAQQSRREAPVAAIGAANSNGANPSVEANETTRPVADAGPFYSPWQRPAGTPVASSRESVASACATQQGSPPCPAPSGTHYGARAISGRSAEPTPSLPTASALPPRMSPVAAIAATPAPLPSRGDTFKSILALVGALAVLYHALRFLGWAIG